MTDIFTPKKRSQVMSRIRSKGNRTTELRLAALLAKAGLCGWRRHLPLPGRPDFVFRRQRVAVFVDGCFWHGCARCAWTPANNRNYWIAKFAHNRAKDKAANRALRLAGWRVIRIWEHDLRARSAWVIARLSKVLLLQ